MRELAAAVLLGFVLLAAAISWLGRYQTTAGEPGHYYLTDRWTGAVLHCVASRPGTDSTKGWYVSQRGGCIRTPSAPEQPAPTLDQILGAPPKPPS
jgi:hypothetical protein